MHRGYTKRWRKRWDKDYCKDHLLFTMMEYFIDHANYKDTEIFFPNVGTIPLKRGEHIFSTVKLSAKLGVDRQRIRSKLKILKNIEFLTIQPTNRYTKIFVINYDIYNSNENEPNQLTNQHLTSTQPATNQQLTTDKKVNKEKKVNKVKIPPFIPPRGEELKNNGYDWIDADSWNQFVSHRKQIRKPLSDRATQISLNFLRAHQADQRQIIETTIMNRWTGLFPLKNLKVPFGQDDTQKKQQSEEAHKRYKDFIRQVK